ncbi:NAD(P)/FAD-dependent oxidoreductase [Bacillus massiliigorillae]|uniref:NAD(P)/FAD-dependent oxidoreductase n=1 Tax=Bacillus massiliigorillae TaxID=1243664 RepID=UPI00039E6DC9|nr:NAD(P)/FAD-dependent oxidoreductase [Bacillus massiliigorillae]
MNDYTLFDVTIIGGGPAGLYSAFYSGLRGMKTKIIEFQSELGGKLRVYPEKMIWDVGGMTPMPCAQLTKQIIQQGLTFNPEVVLDEKIISITKSTDGYFTLQSANGNEHYSKAVIVAIGGGILKPQKLEIEGAERFEVTNLNYTIKSLQRFKDKIVLISGGGNSAIDWANELEPIAKKVYLTYRKTHLNAHEAQISQLIKSSAQCYLSTNITKLIANDENQIESVELMHTETDEKTTVAVDEVIINHGYERESELLTKSNLDIELVDDFYIAGTPNSQTSLPGLFAAGDIVAYNGKVHLIAGAFQDAVNAVNKAKQYIEPDAHESGMVSSHNDVFKERNRELIAQMLS